MWEYIKSGRFDEFTFFLSLLSQNASDFSHPILARIYQERSKSKSKWISCILDIAENEWFTHQEIQQMKILIEDYLQYFDISF